MAYHLLKVFVLVVLASCPQRTNGISSADKTRIEKGLAAGKALVDVLKDGKFRDSLVELGKNFAPFLSTVGPLAGAVLSFIPGGDSKELAYMKKKFKEVNNKLDIITSEFKEVKDAIDWSTVEISFSTYEMKIRTAEMNLNRVYQSNHTNQDKNIFVTAYENNFADSHQILYDAIVENDHIFSKNILEAVVKKTKNFKRKVEQFSLGVVQLLIQAIKVHVAYYAIKKYDTEDVINEWTSKMDEVKRKLEERSNEVKSAYYTQLKKDAEGLIRQHPEVDNKVLMEMIYKFVTDKYDWRYWFVAVYDDVHGYDAHTIVLCGGYSLLHQKNKNIIISSQDKAYKSRFNQDEANNLLEKVDEDIDNCQMRDPKERATTLVDRVTSKIGNNCVPYALNMAIRTGKGLRFDSWKNHRAYHIINRKKRCCRGHGWGRKCKTVSWHYNMLLFG